MFKHDQTPEEYHDQQRSMRASGLLQAIWGSGKIPHYDAQDNESTQNLQIAWVKRMFDKSVEIIEGYVKKEPFKPAGKPIPGAPQRDLRDETVTQNLPEPRNNWPKATYTSPETGKKFTFASEKQVKRAYAIAMGAGFDQKSLREFGFDKFGLTNNKRIPVEVYDQYVAALEQGPNQ